MSWVGQRANLAPQGIVGKALAFCAGGFRARDDGGGMPADETRRNGAIGRETRNRGQGRYGYDHLLPSPDFGAAQALAERAEGRFYPLPPISGYPD
jgi:hypothetical protein